MWEGLPWIWWIDWRWALLLAGLVALIVLLVRILER